MDPDSVPSQEEISESNWKDIIDAADSPTVDAYSRAFFEKAEEAAETEDESAVRACRFLGHITSMIFQLDDPQAPFEPLCTFRNGRSAHPEDFLDSELDLVEWMLPQVDDPELEARLSDLLWLRRTDHEAAEQAVDAYLRSADALYTPDSWLESTRRLERAFQISTLLQNSELHQSVTDAAQALLEAKDSPQNLRHRLLSIMEEFDAGDPQALARQAEDLARQAEEEEDWRSAKSFWSLTRKYQLSLGNQDEARTAQAQMGEMKVRRAEEFVGENDGGYMAAAIHLREAVELLRQAGKTKRAQEVHGQLLDYQQKSQDEMTPIEHRFDTSEEARQAREHVSNVTPYAALRNLALLVSPPSKADLGERTEKWMEDFPLQAVVPMTIVTEEGKPAAKRDSVLDADDEDSVKQAEAVRQAHFDFAMSVQAFIQPARAQILQEYRISRSDFLEICQRSPFVPPSREQTFARGLYDGLVGDFASAVRFLVPEIEHLLRYLLASNGVITSSLDSEGIQEEYPLGKILQLEELEDILGEDLTFTLAALLTSKYGSNFRNRLAHGLVPQGQAHSVAGIYSWWLVLYLVFMPLAIAEKSEEHGEDER